MPFKNPNYKTKHYPHITCTHMMGPTLAQNTTLCEINLKNAEWLTQSESEINCKNCLRRCNERIRR